MGFGDNRHVKRCAHATQTEKPDGGNGAHTLSKMLICDFDIAWSQRWLSAVAVDPVGRALQEGSRGRLAAKALVYV